MISSFIQANACAVMILALPIAQASAQASSQTPDKLVSTIVSAAQNTAKSQDLEAAARLYEAAIVANPASVDAYVGLGKTQAALKRPQAAKRYFATAVKIDPNDLNALQAQSVHMIALGDLSDAENNISRLKRLCSDGCAQLSSVLKAYDQALEDKRSRVLGEGTEGS